MGEAFCGSSALVAVIGAFVCLPLPRDYMDIASLDDEPQLVDDEPQLVDDDPVVINVDDEPQQVGSSDDEVVVT